MVKIVPCHSLPGAIHYRRRQKQEDSDERGPKRINMTGNIVLIVWYSVRLFERDETGRVRGTDTGATVLDGLAVEVKSWSE